MIQLEVKNLSIGYRSKGITTAVSRDINFKVHQGQLVGIIGINGIGKTTLLRTLAGMQHSLEGIVNIDGKPVQAYSAKGLSTLLSVVLTEPLPTRNLNVWELVSLGRQPYTNWLGKLEHHDREIVQQVLSRLRLDSLADKKCYELSDGQMQKVLLARALTQDTPIMVLDEPTTHLDLLNKVEILKLLQEIARNMNKLVIFSSHEIELAIQLCDTLCVLKGQNADFGPPRELIRNGTFNQLFPSDTLSFDPSSGTYSIHTGG